MSQSISITVKSRTSKGETFYEGTATLAGLRPAKLAKTDGCTHFATARAARSAGERLGARLNMPVSFEGQATVRQAAKKSANTKTPQTGN